MCCSRNEIERQFHTLAGLCRIVSRVDMLDTARADFLCVTFVVEALGLRELAVAAFCTPSPWLSARS